MTDARYRPEFRGVRDEFFGLRRPAATMAQVAALSHPDYMIEVEAVAIIQARHQGSTRPRRPSLRSCARAREQRPRLA